MRVLFLTNIPSPYRIDFFNELGKLCDLTVLFERSTAKNRENEWLENRKFDFNAVFLKGISIGDENALCFSVRRWLSKDKFDIIIVGGYSTPTGMLAILTLNRRRIPFVLNSDGGFVKQDAGIRARIKHYFIRSANWWLSSSKSTSEYLVHYGANPNRIFIYPFSSLHKRDINILPASEAEKEQLRKKLGIEGEKVVLGAGQFIHRKGFDTAIEAWANMPKEYTLLIIGSGSEEEKYREMINKKDLKNVQIIGFQNKESLKQYYRASDVFIFPTREDIWGLVVNEAMAQGLPVISTDAALSACELVSNGVNGYLISPDDPKALSDKLHRIFDDDKRILMMGKESIRIISDYSIENMAKTHIEVFEKIIHDKCDIKRGVEQ